MGEKQAGTLIVHVDADLEDLIPGYLDNRRRDIAMILAALDKSDLETIRILGHSMKGSGGGYGFDAITDIGALLEKSANGGDPAGVRRGIERLDAYLNQVEVVYDAAP